jgi:hypothetical protein
MSCIRIPVCGGFHCYNIQIATTAANGQALVFSPMGFQLKPSFNALKRAEASVTPRRSDTSPLLGRAPCTATRAPSSSHCKATPCCRQCSGSQSYSSGSRPGRWTPDPSRRADRDRGWSRGAAARCAKSLARRRRLRTLGTQRCTTGPARSRWSSATRLLSSMAPCSRSALGCDLLRKAAT